jgi:hypothetical protein
MRPVFIQKNMVLPLGLYEEDMETKTSKFILFWNHLYWWYVSPLKLKLQWKIVNVWLRRATIDRHE